MVKLSKLGLRETFGTPGVANKIFWTLFLLALTRLGTFVPIPGIDSSILWTYMHPGQNVLINANGFFERLKYIFSPSSRAELEFLNFFSGGAFSNFSVLMLGVMPYISAQIIIQILMVIIPKLREMAKDPAGSAKLQRWMRYSTIIVCLIQATAVLFYAKSIDGLLTVDMGLFVPIALISCTAGSMFMLWIGERITDKGVGNGVSLLIFAGIVARIPEAIVSIYNGVKADTINIIGIVVLLAIFIVVVLFVIYEETGERRIYVTYSKRIVGRKVYGAQTTHIPFKLNPSGVIPVIFASALLSFPLQIATMLGGNVAWLRSFASWLNPQGAAYIIIYTLLIIAFAFFYTQVSLNPIEIAQQIRENGGTIQGVRPDKIEDYLTKILNRIVLPGSLFLAFIALLPTIVQIVFKFPQNVAMLLGGTSLLIMVGVELETMRALEGIVKSQVRLISDKSKVHK